MTEIKRTSLEGKHSETKLIKPEVKKPSESKHIISDIKVKPEPGRDESHKKKGHSTAKEPHRKHIKKERVSIS